MSSLSSRQRLQIVKRRLASSLMVTCGCVAFGAIPAVMVSEVLAGSSAENSGLVGRACYAGLKQALDPAERIAIASGQEK